jgi:hypothetical protein
MVPINQSVLILKKIPKFNNGAVVRLNLNYLKSSTRRYLEVVNYGDPFADAYWH